MQQRTFSDLFGGVLTNARDLVRTELALLSAELSGKASKIVSALVFGVVALFVVLMAVVFILLTIMYALAALGLPTWIAAFIVAVVCLALAGGLAYLAVSRLKEASPVPHRFLKQVREDGSALARSFSDV